MSTPYEKAKEAKSKAREELEEAIEVAKKACEPSDDEEDL